MPYDAIAPYMKVLEAKVGFLRKTTVDDQRRALDALSRQACVYDLQYVAPLLLRCQDGLAHEIARLVRTLLCSKGVWDKGANLYASFNWLLAEALMERADALSLPLELSVHILGLASLNQNGYIRQKALVRMGSMPHPEAFPYILVRLNDWVGEVQAEAERAFASLLPTLQIQDIVPYGGLICALAHMGRRDLTHIRAQIAAHMREPVRRGDLINAMDTGSLKERLFLCHMVGPEQDVVEAAFHSRESLVRVWALTQLPQDETSLQRVTHLLRDPSSRVRLTALRRVPETRFLEKRPFFEAALFDPARGVREYATFVMTRLGETDIASLYRQAVLKATPPSPGALMGLAQKGVPGDTEILLPFMAHPNGRVRAAVLTACARWGLLEMDARLLEGLGDTSAKVRRACALILARKHRHLRPQLKDLVMKAPLKTAQSAFFVLVQYGGLEALEGILLALARPDDALRPHAWKRFEAWWQRSYTLSLYHVDQQLLGDIEARLTTLRTTGGEPCDKGRSAWDALPQYLARLRKKP
ncbi:MAG: hypothetical protein C0514_08645 [Candidatus Puniceispirillum sp.]|nr:hypothetical protein [Candidatus Puniceispirillum sp.]